MLSLSVSMCTCIRGHSINVCVADCVRTRCVCLNRTGRLHVGLAGRIETLSLLPDRPMLLKTVQKTKSLKSLDFSFSMKLLFSPRECDFNAIHFKFIIHFSTENTACVFSTKWDATAMPGRKHMGICREYTF